MGLIGLPKAPLDGTVILIITETPTMSPGLEPLQEGSYKWGILYII